MSKLLKLSGKEKTPTSHVVVRVWCKMFEVSGILLALNMPWPALPPFENLGHRGTVLPAP
jgi:hypothetical protein